MRREYFAPTFQQLAAEASPPGVAVPETIPWWLYDTETFVSATTRQLEFFRTTKQDPRASNMKLAGQLPDPQAFRIHAIYFDFLRADGAFVSHEADETGTLDDIGRLVLASRAIWTFSLMGKDYGPFPLSVTRGTGGGIGFLASDLAGSVQYGNNGVLNGGAPLSGALIIPRQSDFSISVDWRDPVTTSDDYHVRCAMFGDLSRAVR